MKKPCSAPLPLKPETAPQLYSVFPQEGGPRMQEPVSHLTDGLFFADGEGRLLYWNGSAERITGAYGLEKGRYLWEAVPALQEVEAMLLRVHAEGAVAHTELFDSVQKKWLRLSLYPGINRVALYIRNTSRQRMALEDLQALSRKVEEVRRAGEKRFRAMLEAGRDVVALVDGRGRVHSFTPNLQTVTGYPPEALEDGGCFDYVHPEDLPRLKAEAALIFSQQRVELSPYRFRTKDGRWIWVEARLTNYLSDGDIASIIVNFRDITRHREADAVRRMSEERYRLLFQSNPVPMWICRRSDYRFMEVNAAATQLYGYSREEFLCMTLPDLADEEEVPRMEQLLQGGLDGSGYRNHQLVDQRRRDGSLVVADMFLHDIELEGGPHVIAIAFDRSDKVALEQLVIQERLSAQQEVFKAIMDTQERERSEIGKELHDNINQLLTTAKLYVENIHYYPEEQPKYVEKSVSLMQRSITEIRSLSKALVTPTLYDLGFLDSLQEMIDHYRELRLFEVHYRFSGALQRIDTGVRLTVYRVVQEQLNNIVKYAGCTEVWVCIREQRGGLRLEVRDNGCGFDPNARAGGLGLTNIRNRAEVYSGKVCLETAPGAGCSLQVRFPSQRESRQPAAGSRQ